MSKKKSSRRSKKYQPKVVLPPRFLVHMTSDMMSDEEVNDLEIQGRSCFINIFQGSRLFTDYQCVLSHLDIGCYMADFFNENREAKRLFQMAYIGIEVIGYYQMAEDKKLDRCFLDPAKEALELLYEMMRTLYRREVSAACYECKYKWENVKHPKLGSYGTDRVHIFDPNPNGKQDDDISNLNANDFYAYINGRVMIGRIKFDELHRPVFYNGEGFLTQVIKPVILLAK